MSEIALITGATSGIGAACAQVFAREGYNLILTGRRRERLEKLAAELTAQFKVKVFTLMFDIRDREQVNEKLEDLPAEWQKIAILVNNAGLSLGLDPIQNGNIEDWETMIDTNIKGLL